MLILAKWTIIFFGIFLISAGLLMLLNPVKVRAILRKAGSTNLINYAEITIRMIPAAALIIYADFTRFPLPVKWFGWFMLATSLILYFVPRKLHHQFSLSAADILKPLYFQMVAPFSILFGLVVIYCVSN